MVVILWPMREDNYRHKGMRRQLVDLIRSKGIQDERVLEAIGNIPRHWFLDKAFLEIAYEDRAFPIGKDQTISQPYTVAYQTSLLKINKGDKVLEIGTGSGYQACVLAEMGAKVFTVERQQELYEKTRKFLRTIGYPTIKCFFKDGFEGLPTYAPFDKIIVTAAAPEIPQALIDQLKTGGLLVIPYGKEEVQQMLRIHKLSETETQEEVYDHFSFVPMLKGKNW